MRGILMRMPSVLDINLCLQQSIKADWTFKMQSPCSMLCLCLASALLGKLQAYPTLQKEGQSSWFDLFSPDGSIVKEKLEKFPLYEYGFEDYEYGDQIWSDCGKI